MWTMIGTSVVLGGIDAIARGAANKKKEKQIKKNNAKKQAVAREYSSAANKAMSVDTGATATALNNAEAAELNKQADAVLSTLE